MPNPVPTPAEMNAMFDACMEELSRDDFALYRTLTPETITAMRYAFKAGIVAVSVRNLPTVKGKH